MSRRAKIVALVVVGTLVVLALSFFAWYRSALAPMPKGDPFYIRFEEGTTFDGALDDLIERGVVRNKDAFTLFCYLTKSERSVRVGTFEFNPGMTPRQVLSSLKRPVEQQIRLPEGWWIARVAPRLEEKGVCTAQEYIDAAHNPDLFRDDVSFPLPEDSLEGYLYPDTYDLPPLLGAEAVVRRQLQAFEEKVWNEIRKLPHSGEVDLHTVLTTASLVELEAGVDEDRPRIAGVINNRLAANQRLQIDATALYAIQEWKVLRPGEIATIDHPYNTYKIDGLPPGPIGSPAWRSIKAVLEPEQHGFFFYVARPDLTHYFSATYAEHLQNIRKARAEFAQRQDL